MGHFNTPKSGDLPLTRDERRHRRARVLRISLAAGVLLIALGFAIRVNRPVLATGYVTAEHYAEVRSSTIGTVAQILAQSGVRVAEGDLLVQLDCAGELAAFEEARSQTEKAEAELTRRTAEIAEQKRRLNEDIAVAALRLQNSTSRLERTREMLTRGLVAGSALEDDTLKANLGRAELASLTNRDLTVFDKEIEVLRRELEARREAAARMDAGVKARQVRAPIAGQALRYDFVIGELVRPDTVLYEIFGGDKQILKLRVAERHAARVAPGNRYVAWLGPYRGLQRVRFKGEVLQLRNVIQSEGQTTYRVAYCSFDPGGRVVPPGATAEARIYCGKTCLWLFLFGLD